MGREATKLEEARFFWKKLVNTSRNTTEFTYYLSAFLSAARSVLQYVHKSVLGTPHQEWYDARLSSTPVLQFLKEQRNVNIHDEPVRIEQGTIKTTVHRIGLAKTLRITTGDGRVLFEQTREEVESNPETDGRDPRTEIQEGWRFTDWEGERGIIAICGRGISELDNVVEEGIKEGYLEE